MVDKISNPMLFFLVTAISLPSGNIPRTVLSRLLQEVGWLCLQLFHLVIQTALMTIWCDGDGCNQTRLYLISTHIPNLEGSWSLGHTSGRTHITECTTRAWQSGGATAWPIHEAPSWPSRESAESARLPVQPLGQQSVIATDRTQWCSCAAEKSLSHPGTTSHSLWKWRDSYEVSKVKNLPDCNHDKPEGKTARTGKMGEGARVTQLDID